MDTFLFDLASQYTGGIVTDAKTAMAAMLAFGFIIMGLEIILSAVGLRLSDISSARLHSQYRNEARLYHSLLGSAERGSFEHDYYSLKYRRYLAKAADYESPLGGRSDFNFGKVKSFGRSSSHTGNRRFNEDLLE